ncbi:hypothetical protein N7526_005012 [Penicillium atrosanguineum]|nr:hypothetical protein N7526_005012 [Penicillium atrosanguineum]
MKDKMRVVLRCAADNHHRKLVLGALGCGVFAHPAQEVTDCWKVVLQEKEFRGWFEYIVFAVLDTGENYTIFWNTLHDLTVKSPRPEH